MRALIILSALAIPAIAGAQGFIFPGCPRPLPNRPIIDCAPARQNIVRTRSDVRVELRDRVLRYEVEERFVNRGGLIGEADYVFPLPKGAAFRDLKLSIDGELVAGETMNAVEARRIYEEIVRRQRDPALVEWMGHGLLRTRIFPIQPGEERRVVVRFESVAEREGDAVRVDYFRGSNPVSAPGTPRVERLTSNPAPAHSRFSLTYRAGGDLGEPHSPTHEIDVERDGALRRVSIARGGPDVTILVTLQRSAAASVTLLPHARRDEQGFALLTITPPAELANVRMPRDLTFVLDVSGSMAGTKLTQAKAAGRQLLRTLNAGDRFRIIDFSTDVRSFRDDYVFATAENVRAAIRYLDDLDGTGSTNIAGALERALEHSGFGRRESGGDFERMPLVLFMTDGAATIGERNPDVIAANAARTRGDARVFSFGIGADVNIGLIEQLALQGRGTPHFVRPDEDVERVVGLVAAQLRQPLLTDVRVTVDGDAVRLSRTYPAGALDVFAGQDLVLLARYDGSGDANVVVTGRAAGRDVRWSTLRNFPREERDNAFVPRLWATQRIGWLASEKRRSGGSAEIDEEIRTLGERFGIPTEFTSYLVLEPGRVARAGDMSGTGAGAVSPTVTGRRREMAGSATGAPMPAPPPAQVQFEAAKAAAERRDARSLAAADASVALNDAVSKRAGSRIFTKDGDRWVDSRMKPGLPVYKVKAYSRSYFTLLERIPELREAFAAGDRVLVAGSSVALEVVDDAPEIAMGELDSIVRRW